MLKAVGGRNHSFALAAPGRAFTWGRHVHGQLGHPAAGGGAKKGKQPAYVRTGGWRLPPLGRAPTLKECVHLWEEQVRKRASRAREGVLSAKKLRAPPPLCVSVSLARGRT